MQRALCLEDAGCKQHAHGRTSFGKTCMKVDEIDVFSINTPYGSAA